MARKAQTNPHDLDDKVIACFIDDHGNEVTTIQDRKNILEHWCRGDYEFHRDLAAEKKILPIALLVAVLMDANHPLVMQSATEPFNTMECAVRILRAMYGESPIPVQLNSFNRRDVERIELSTG